MDVRIQCHACTQPIILNAESAGQEFRCPSCGTTLTAPSVIETPPLPVGWPPKSETREINRQSGHCQPAASPRRQESLGWDVFKGLFGFFIVLPLCIAIGCVLLLVLGGSVFSLVEPKPLENERPPMPIPEMKLDLAEVNAIRSRMVAQFGYEAGEPPKFRTILIKVLAQMESEAPSGMTEERFHVLMNDAMVAMYAVPMHPVADYSDVRGLFAASGDKLSGCYAFRRVWISKFGTDPANETTPDPDGSCRDYRNTVTRETKRLCEACAELRVKLSQNNPGT